MVNYSQTIKIEERLLRLVVGELSVGIPSHLDIRSLEGFSSNIGEILKIQAKLFCWTEKAGGEIRRISYPATCWQHLKQGFFLWDGWVLKRWPVKMTTDVVTFELKAMYPEFRRSVPDGKMVSRIFVKEEKK